MANIQPQIDDIRNARYGRDVRESIATGLEAMNAESSEAYNAAITAQTSATASAQQASQSATNASNYASSASQSATTAQNASQGVQTALTQAQQASASAKASETAAKTSETNAKASETASKTSETNAKTSETNALAYSQSAQSAGSSAQSAASSAQASASAASNSQTASASSAQNAKNSEEAARQWAEQASSVVNIETMTTSKNGIGRPDGTSITVNQFGVFSASGITTHASKQIASNDGVHGERVLDGKLQHWDDGLSEWVTDIEEVKVDGTTITKDEDGVLHGVQTYELPKASTTVLGGVKIGKGLNIEVDGTVNATGGATIEFNESLELLFLRDANNVIISQTHIEAGGVATIVHVDTHEESWFGNENVTIEVSDGDEDIQNGHFDATGDYVTKIHHLGTYTATVTDELGQTYVTTFEDSQLGSVLYVFVEPYGYSAWLKAGRVEPSAYSSLDEVLADEKIVRQLMTIHASVDYLATWMGNDVADKATFLASDNALKWIGLRDYAYDHMPQDFITSWLEGDKWEYALKDKVPVMTSDTAPYGQVSYSSQQSSSRAFNVFNDSGLWGSIQSGSAWVQYKFTNPHCIRKFSLVQWDQILASKVTIQGSNDGSTFSDLGTFDLPNTLDASINLNNDNWYLYYRCVFTSSKSDYIGMRRVQFYGRSLDVSVPKMISNTEPWGEAFGSAYTSTNYPWKAFDKDSNTLYEPSSSEAYLGYNFKKEVLPKGILLTHYWISSFNINIEGSKNGNDGWEVIDTVNISQVSSDTNIYIPLSAIKSYKAIRISAPSGIKELQFYGLDYSEREFAEGSTMKYLYDHGLELNTLTDEISGSGNTIEHKSSSVVIEKNNTTSSPTIYVFLSSLIDITNYRVIKVVIDGTGSGDNAISVGVDDIPNLTTNNYYHIANKSFRNVGPFEYLDVISVTGNLYCKVGAGYNDKTMKVEVKEWWLE